MSISTWGEPESYTEEAHPSAMIKHLLKQMMTHFAAQGACIALFDESIGQMRVRLHVRVRIPQGNITTGGLKLPSRRMTVHLENDEPPQRASTLGRMRNVTPPVAPLPHVEDLEDVTLQQNEQFAVGSIYSPGHDLIGQTWLKNEAYVMHHEDYLALFYNRQPMPLQTDILPTWYLAVPIRKPMLIDDKHGHKQQAIEVLGVIVLYQISQSIGASFQAKQRSEAIHYVERIALYLQNHTLHRAQLRASGYLQRIQDISTTFPTTVNLPDLVEHVYKFVKGVVNVSSMLLTLYDRDTDKIYDLFAVNNGIRVEGLIDQPTIMTKEDRSLPTYDHV